MRQPRHVDRSSAIARSPHVRRHTAILLTRVVLVIQVALLAMLWLDQSRPPQTFGSVGQTLWALRHQPSFYPLAAAIVVGLPCTLIAGLVRGRHRLWLASGWVVTVGLIGVYHGPKVAAMLRVLWRHYT